MRPGAGRRWAGILLAAGLAAGALRALPRQGADGTLATLTGGSVRVATPDGGTENSAAGAELDAAGHLRIEDGARIDLDGEAARLDLLRGGSIRLCGPARMSLASGGGGALLVSLEAGGLELRYASPVADSLLTPDYRIATVVPPGQMATVSASVALQADGTMCVRNVGSALSVERLWDGAQQYVINGQSFAFHPAGEAAAVASCPCAAAAAAAVAPAHDQPNRGAGALFPSEPALTVAANGSGGATSAPTAPTAGATVAAPAPAQRHNFVVRFLRWFVGKKN